MTKKYYISWSDFEEHIAAIVDQIHKEGFKPEIVMGVRRGGLVPAVVLSHRLGAPLCTVAPPPDYTGNMLIVDDVSDSGSTLTKITKLYPLAKLATIMIKSKTGLTPHYYSDCVDQDVWIVFPWEEKIDITVTEE